MSDPDFSRNLSLELARVTEAAAIMAGRWMGRNEKEKADQAAVDAMRQVLDSIEMEGMVVIGEGEKDNAPMLYSGEIVGRGDQPKVDIAVDPIDGTRLLALGMPNSLCVLAIAERGAFYSWEHISYMEKIAVGPEASGRIDLRASVADNLKNVADAKNRKVDDLTVVILDRPRHESLINDVRAAGARLKLITDGDVAGALLATMEGTGIDVLLGTGGSPEAVIAAAALRCVGGDMQCRLYPRNEQERAIAKANDIDLQRIYQIDDLVGGDEVFFAATGITDGELLDGVHYGANGITTHSLVMRAASGTVRFLKSTHRPEKLKQLTSMQFD